ncbi:MAG: hypothetical protein A3E82_07595 [Gammaproteobacteria bacterium RIFCSPHIGHO2_12_FULL_38_11]|nr:MAG: hypothetical protein A3E82_07595 [Gammaproteobacteria bacterium RIFCSPHIGHO2_12_FULL_38_11]
MDFIIAVFFRTRFIAACIIIVAYSFSAFAENPDVVPNAAFVHMSQLQDTTSNQPALFPVKQKIQKQCRVLAQKNKTQLTRQQTLMLKKCLAEAVMLAKEESMQAIKTQPIKAFGNRGIGLPGVSLSSPNAFGGGQAFFASVGFVNHVNGTSLPDGFMGLGFSFGDPHKLLGVVVSASNDNIGWRQDAFLQNGGFGFRINRYLAKNTAVAFGLGTLAGWGVMSNISKSYYLALTQGIPLRFPITLNAGVQTASSAAGNLDSQYQGFGGIGVSVYKNVSLIADYATEQFNVGGNYSFIFLKKLPMFLTIACANVTGQFNSSPHLLVSFGFAQSF